MQRVKEQVEEAPSDCVAEAGSSALFAASGSAGSAPPAVPQPEVSWTVMDSTGYSRARTSNVSQITAHLGQGIAGLFPGMAQVARNCMSPTTACGSTADATARPSIGGAECRDAGNLSGDGTSDAQDLPVHTSAKKRGRPITRNLTENENTSSVQEKNRQAQARFRQRQKVRQCLWYHAELGMTVLPFTCSLAPHQSSAYSIECLPMHIVHIADFCAGFWCLRPSFICRTRRRLSTRK